MRPGMANKHFSFQLIDCSHQERSVKEATSGLRLRACQDAAAVSAMAPLKTEVAHVSHTRHSCLDVL